MWNEHHQERVAALKRLEAQWSAELLQLQDVDAERARHHVEALEDLAILIRNLERETAHPDD
jgi:hypothetical protein